MNTISTSAPKPVTSTATIVVNGGDQLPEHRQKIVEAGNAAYQAVAAERDELERLLHEANKKIAEMTVQVDSLNSITTMMESSYKSAEIKMQGQIDKYQKERDDAVQRTAKVEAILDNISAVLAYDR